jgi:hypothetical protein
MPPTQEFNGSTVYMVKSISNAVEKTYTVNRNSGFCSCLDIIHKGTPCRHLISLWRFLGLNLAQTIYDYTNPHWIVNSQISSNANYNLQRQVIINVLPPFQATSSTILPVDITSAKNNSLTMPKSISIKNTKKRKLSPTANGKTSLIKGPLAKKLKFADKRFAFIGLKDNSCRFDVLLALLYFIRHDIPDYLEKAVQNIEIRKHLDHLFGLLDASQFLDAQKAFRDYLVRNKLTLDKGDEYGSISVIIEHMFDKGEKYSLIEVLQEYHCSNKNCMVEESVKDTPVLEVPLWDYQLIDDADKSEGILANFFRRYVQNPLTSGECDCIVSKRATRLSKSCKYEKTFKIKHLPECLIINLESLSLFSHTELNSLTVNITIEETFHTVLKNEALTLNLQAIVYFERSHHFTLAYFKPKHNNDSIASWGFYDSKLGVVQDFLHPEFNIKKLISIKRVPILLCYKISKLPVL